MQTTIIDPQDNGFRIELEAAVAAAISAEDMAGELLFFRDAVLVRAETNQNGDRFDMASLHEIAASVPLMPIDYEHVEKRLVGLFTAARVEGDAVLTDGLIYAKRFPEVAADVVAGKLKLSVEVQIGTAMCSVCQAKFKTRKEYCAHLREPKRYAAARVITDLKCIGGGVTYNPAGTNTTFDRQEMVFMASQGSDGVIAMLEDIQEDGMEIEELKAEIQRLTDSLTAANTLNAEKDALVASKDGEIAKLQAGIEGEKRVRERSLRLLQVGYTPEQLQPIEADLATASDSVVELLIASAKTEEQTTTPADAGAGEQANASTNDDKADGKGEEKPKPTPAALGDATGGNGDGVLRWTPEIFG